MPKFVFNTCCGCIELRTGCLILGYIKLVVDIILFILGLLALIGGGLVANQAENKNQETVGVVFMVVGVILLIAVVLSLTLTIVLLVGVHQGKRGHIKTFLILMTIILVLYIIAFLVGLAHPGSVIKIIQKVAEIALDIYFMLVIRSYYYKMNAGKPPAYNTA